MLGVGKASVAVVATLVLTVGFVVLLPQGAEAAKVHMVGGGVSHLDASEDFTVTFQLEVPAGERVPADFARVLVAAAGTGLDGSGTLSSHFCEATTGGTPSASIESVVGADATFGTISATGYDVSVSGSGYEFTSPGALFGGYGTGYGYGGTADVLVTVTVKVSGCSFTYSGGTQGVVVQAFLGTTGEQLKSFPVAMTFFDPTLVTTLVQDDSADVAVSTSFSGDVASLTATITGGDGGDSVAPGTTITIPATPGTGLGEITGVTKKALPNGSTLSFSMVSDQTGGTPSLGAPYFGIGTDALDAQTNSPPGIFFQITLSVPGEGNVPVGEYFSEIVVEALIGNDYFTSNGISATNFLLRGFNADGTLKGGVAPVLLSRTADTPVVDTWTFKFRITTFSSFAGVVPIATGGGGGGGGGGTTTTTDTGTGTGTTPPSDPPTSPPSDPPTSPPSDPPTSPPSDPGAPGGDPGDDGGLATWVIVLIVLGSLAVIGLVVGVILVARRP